MNTNKLKDSLETFPYDQESQQAMHTLLEWENKTARECEQYPSGGDPYGVVQYNTKLNYLMRIMEEIVRDRENSLSISFEGTVS